MRLLPLFLMLFAMGPAEAFRDSAKKAYIINVTDSVQSEIHKRNSEQLFRFIYNELNIRPEFRYLPSKRGLQMVNEGVLDAEAGRLAQAVTSYHNLQKVTVPVATLHIGIFCIEEKLCALQGDSVLAAFEGFRMAMPFCQKMQIICKTNTNSQSLVKLINQGLADALFATTLDATQILCTIGSKQVFYLALPQLDVNVHHFVHKKHENLIPALEKAVILARQQGVVDKLLAFWREELNDCGVTVINTY